MASKSLSKVMETKDSEAKNFRDILNWLKVIVVIVLLNSSQGYAQNVTVLASGFGHLSGLAIDSANKIYFTQSSSRSIGKMDLDGTNLTSIMPATFFGQLQGIAIDPDGTIYVSDGYNKLLVKLNAQGGTVWTKTMSNPRDIALDSQGNIYVANGSYLTVMDKEGNGISTLALGMSNITGVAVDLSNNIYVCSWTDNFIKKTDINGNSISLGAGFKNAYGLAVDLAGNIYVADSANNVIKKMDPAGTTISLIEGGFDYPTAVAVDLLGNLYVADYGNFQIKKVEASTLTVLEKEIQNISLFPNPTSNYFSVNGLENETLLQIIDTNGRVVLEEHTSNGEIVSTGRLIKGLYLVSIAGQTRKLLIQ